MRASGRSAHADEAARELRRVARARGRRGLAARAHEPGAGDGGPVRGQEENAGTDATSRGLVRRGVRFRARARRELSPPSKAPPKKKLTAAQQNEEDRATLHRKLQEAEALMIKATEKSIALATIEESMLRLQKLVLVERDGRRVAEVEAEEANRSLQRAEEKLKREMEERHVMQLRVTAAQELAGEAEDKYRELKMLDRTKEKVAAESFNGGDRSEHEKILEQDLANARRELAEALAAEKEARAIKELDARTAEERPRIDEDPSASRWNVGSKRRCRWRSRSTSARRPRR